MPKVHVIPLGQTLDAREGDTIMETAWNHGLYWPTTCGGQGSCTSCACSIEEGAENLDELGRSERKTLAAERGEAALRDGTLRLACQARVRGDVTVNKPGVRPARPSALSLEP
jgi:2Fe-2S ferredoxin